MIEFLTTAPVMFAAGFALCWFGKDKITMLVTGAENFIRALEAKAAALKAKL